MMKFFKIIKVSSYSSNICFSIKAETFQRAADEITKLFPGETAETYYIPYSSPKLSGRRQSARGKLWSRYTNVKAALRIAYAGEASIPKQTDVLEANINQNQINDDLNFIKVAIEPYHKVLQCWEATADVRNKLYRDKTITDIYNDFPALKLQMGIDLVSCNMDFNFKNNSYCLCFAFSLRVILIVNIPRRLTSYIQHGQM